MTKGPTRRERRTIRPRTVTRIWRQPDYLLVLAAGAGIGGAVAAPLTLLACWING